MSAFKRVASAFIRRLPLVVCFALGLSAHAIVASSELPDPGPVANFTEFGNQPLGNLAMINGNFSLAYPVTFTQLSIINGATFNNQNLATEPDAIISPAVLEWTPVETFNGSGATLNPVPEPRELILMAFSALFFQLWCRRLYGPNVNLRRKNQPK